MQPAYPHSELESIQGNILIPFHHECQAFLLLRFTDISSIAQWLWQLSRFITFNNVLMHENSSNCARNKIEACNLCVSFTHHGLVNISSIVEDDLARFVAFKEGPAARAPKLRDDGLNAPEKWVFGGPAQPGIHSILIVAAAHEKDLEKQIAHQSGLAGQFGVEVVYTQRCKQLQGKLAGCEHFGFKDGISQPRVRGIVREVEDNSSYVRDPLLPPGEFILGHPRVGGRRHFCPVWMRNGSFQVVRRMTQDVPGWNEQLSRIKLKFMHDKESTHDALAAKLIGRWKSGTPLAIAPDADDGSSPDVQFDFASDPEGFVTPRFSHIRKMHPRIPGFPERNWRRIIRRAIPFGPPYDPSVEACQDHVDRGLLLNAYMASIEDQFEFLLRSWANDPDFLEAEDGPDPVIGRSASPICLRQKAGVRVKLHLGQYVYTTGALYGFVPSRAGLRHLISIAKR
jgi:Dyp-type peroxidase family